MNRLIALVRLVVVEDQPDLVNFQPKLKEVVNSTLLVHEYIRLYRTEFVNVKVHMKFKRLEQQENILLNRSHEEFISLKAIR